MPRALPRAAWISQHNTRRRRSFDLVKSLQCRQRGNLRGAQFDENRAAGRLYKYESTLSYSIVYRVGPVTEARLLSGVKSIDRHAPSRIIQQKAYTNRMHRPNPRLTVLRQIAT